MEALGINLTPIMVKRIVDLKFLRGRSLAVDAANYLHQFLALIRTRDGSLLKDSDGNVTSHLTGLMYRSTRLMLEFEIDLVFVFDGKPPELKQGVIRKRRRQREKALEDWQNALKRGDHSKAFSKAVMTGVLSRDMVNDARRLLTLLGIPHVQAPSEGEAQAAFMAAQGDVWAASSKDYDSLLFGAPRLLRFLTIQGREYLPSKGMTRRLKPELINLKDLLLQHGIERSQLVDLAILAGTDFNVGIKGIGPKTALKTVKKYGRIENLPDELLSKVPPRYNDVREIFLNPKAQPDYELKLGPLQKQELFAFLCDQRGFSRSRVEEVVRRIEAVHKRKKQANLKKWL